MGVRAMNIFDHSLRVGIVRVVSAETSSAEYGCLAVVCTTNYCFTNSYDGNAFAVSSPFREHMLCTNTHSDY